MEPAWTRTGNPLPPGHGLALQLRADGQDGPGCGDWFRGPHHLLCVVATSLSSPWMCCCHVCHVMWGDTFGAELAKKKKKKKAGTESYTLPTGTWVPHSFLVWYKAHLCLFKNQLLSYVYFLKLCLSFATSTTNYEVSLFPLLLTSFLLKFCISLVKRTVYYFLQNVRRVWAWNKPLQFSLQCHLREENKLCDRDTEEQTLSGTSFLFLA